MLHLTKFAALTVFSAALLAAQGDPSSRVGRLNYIEGSVSFQPDGVDEWVEASLNRPLIPGDNVWVGNRGRSELHVGSTALRLGPNTAFQFLNLDDQAVQIRLSEGTLSVRVRYLDRNQVFEVDTPNVSFTILRPGDYRIDADPDSQATFITVRDGEGEVTGDDQIFPLYARQQVVVEGDDRISYNLNSAPRPDAWDQWSSSRDLREDRSPSARYVSREIPGYDDLDQYGRWDNQPGYGNVWMPTSVSVGWVPYHDGHWAWIAPWGWTWVDDAPWGFAPYHYGRWASFNGRWGWIPGPYGVTPVYAPALVGWIGGGRGGSGFSLSFSIGTAAAVAWFPLGPREPYFPSYQVSQGYFTRVNNTNTVINNTTINNYYVASRNSDTRATAEIRYANQNVQNAVTAVPQSTFARGRRVTQDARSVPVAQLASAQVISTPAIAPQRESVLGGRADTSSRAARPPANVLSRPVVARTAPPAAKVPFEQQQPALTQNPGRPLPTARVQPNRQGAPAANNAPVRVVDMNRVKRVQPAVGADPQNAPAASERQKGKSAKAPELQPQPAVAQPQNLPQGQQRRRQETAPAQPAQPQPAVIEPQRVPPGQQRRRQETAPAPEPQNGQGKQRQQKQAEPAQAAQPQPAAAEPQRVPPGQQRRQPETAPAPAPPPQTPVTAAPAQPQPAQPAATPQPAPKQDEPRQGKGKGKQQKSAKEDDSKGKQE